MKIHVVSSPPIVLKGLMRPVTGVLEALRGLTFIFTLVWDIPVKFGCFLSILGTGRNKKLRTRVFPLGSLWEKEVALLPTLISRALWFRPAFPAAHTILYLSVCSLSGSWLSRSPGYSDIFLRCGRCRVLLQVWRHALNLSGQKHCLQSWKPKLFRNWHLLFFPNPCASGIFSAQWANLKFKKWT